MFYCMLQCNRFANASQFAQSLCLAEQTVSFGRIEWRDRLEWPLIQGRAEPESARVDQIGANPRIGILGVNVSLHRSEIRRADEHFHLLRRSACCRGETLD